MKFAPALSIIAALVLLLTWLSLRAINPEAEMFDHALAEVDHFAMLESALYRDVFTARAGSLRSYDPLVHEIDALRASLDRLRQTAAIDADTNAEVDRLAASVDRQEGLIERFKSENALLHNSLAFFVRFGPRPASPQLGEAVTAAAAAMLQLTLDTSPAAVREVKDQLDELERQAGEASAGTSVEGLLAHGRLLHDLLPSVDGILRTIRALPRKQYQDELPHDDHDPPDRLAGFRAALSPVSVRNVAAPGRVPGPAWPVPEVARQRAAAARGLRARDRRHIDALHQRATAGHR